MNGSHTSEAREALEALVDAGTVWAATGHGQPLVHAAALALTAGLDSPSLRVLAGAPNRFADEEATDLAPDVLAELGLELEEKFSEGAYVALARLRARQFLDGEMSARALANELWSLYAAADYSSVLSAASGLGDWFTLLDDGIIPTDEATADAQVREAAEELARGRTPKDRHYFNRDR